MRLRQVGRVKHKSENASETPHLPLGRFGRGLILAQHSRAQTGRANQQLWEVAPARRPTPTPIALIQHTRAHLSPILPRRSRPPSRTRSRPHVEWLPAAGCQRRAHKRGRLPLTRDGAGSTAICTPRLLLLLTPQARMMSTGHGQRGTPQRRIG